MTRALFFAFIFAISCVAGVRAADEPFEATQIGKYDNTNSGMSLVTSVALSGSTIVGGTSSGGMVVWKMGTNGNVTKTATIPDGTQSKNDVRGLSGSIVIRGTEYPDTSMWYSQTTDVYELGDDGSSALLKSIAGQGNAAIDGDVIITSDRDGSGVVFLYEMGAHKYENVTLTAEPYGGVGPVSYTHLTLPTILRV